MNAIMNRGFVSPYINFNFATGSIEPDGQPPSYFISLVNTRDANLACNFTLQLTYTPGNYNEQTANMIHQLLLTSVKKPVTYGYGYITPGGGVDEQNQAYAGIFTEYDESINDGYLTYTIKGVAHSVESQSPIVNVGNMLSKLKTGYTTSVSANDGNIVSSETTNLNYIITDIANISGQDLSTTKLIQPSWIVEYLVRYDETSGVKECFDKYDFVIAHTDEQIDVNSIEISDTCSLHDLFFGYTKTNGEKYPSGLVYYSKELRSVDELLSTGLLSQYDYRNYIFYQTMINNGISSQSRQELKDTFNAVQKLKTIPYICFYDNVVNSLGSQKKGTFYYVPKHNRQQTNIFYYDYGNSYIDSDVLDFGVTFNGAKAIASVAALDKVNTNIDVNGELVGSNSSIVQPDGFVKQSYTSLSGFDESTWLSEDVLAKALFYQYEATMTVVGQTDCNKLMDNIYVFVALNGVIHPGFTGYYQIIGIEDNLSSSGFTTTFKLVRAADEVGASTPNILTNPHDESSRAYSNEQLINGR